jgi:RNA polymerase sigma-70 factor (ECF subfamily)
MEIPVGSTARLDDATIEHLLVQVIEIARDAAARIVSGDDADDVVQQVVMDCLIRMREHRWKVSREHLTGVVRRMVLWRAIDGWRTRGRRRARETEHARELSEGTHAWMSPDLMHEDRELRDLQEQTLGAIPRVCRRAYVMVRLEDLSYEEAAERLGVSPRTVKSHVARAQRRFREELERLGIQAPYRNGRAAAKRSA